MRVLFLRSNPINPDPRVEKAAFSLAELGHTVSVLGWDRSATLESDQPNNQFYVQRLKIKAAYGTGLGNLPALLRWQWGCLQWLFRHRNEFDVIHACDFDTIIPALVAKLLWKKKVVYDIFDFYADHLRSTPQWIKDRIRSVDKVFIGWVDGIILVDEARFEQIAGANPKRCIVIYNTPEDTSRSLLENETSFVGGTLNIVYIGLLQLERGISEVLDVLTQHPTWHLSLAGFGGDEVYFQERASQMNNVSWYGRVSYDRALQLSAQADVLFATYDPAIQNHRYASPNKVFEAMMLGKPIVVARGTNIDRMIEENRCGFVIDYGDIESLEHVFRLLCNNPELRSRLGGNARQAYENKYTWSKMASRLGEMYAELQS